MEDSPNEFETIFNCVETIKSALGAKWLSRGLCKLRGQRSGPGNPGRSVLIDQQHHPVFESYSLFLFWLDNCIATKQFLARPVVLEIIKLGTLLERCKNLAGFNGIVAKLRKSETFHSAQFEMEVAFYFLNHSLSVEFIEERSIKTPDLLVKTHSGDSLWVECKLRSGQSDRDIKNEGIRAKIHHAILRRLQSEGWNYAIFIRHEGDLKDNDIQPLCRRIFDIDQNDMNPYWGSEGNLRSIMINERRFSYNAMKIAGLNDLFFGAIPAKSVRNWDFTFQAEAGHTTTGEQVYRNPRIIAFSSTTPSDYIVSTINSVKSAAKQLPKEGPGAIFVGMPLASDQSTDQHDQLVDHCLAMFAGDTNSRLNVIAILQRGTVTAKRNNSPGVKFEHRIRYLFNDKARQPLPEEMMSLFNKTVTKP